MKVTIEKDTATVTLPLLAKNTPTKKGDKWLVASTKGTVSVQGADGKNYGLNINITTAK